jgi:predicted dehydrogenase
VAERLKIGIAGCGAIARDVHIPLLMRRADVSVSGIAEPDAELLAAAKARLPAALPFATLDEMLGNTELDAVVVALPTDAHAAAACAVLEAGCDLYLDKPMAANLADGARVVDTWRASGRIAMMGFNARFNPLHLRLRQLVQSGRAGKLVYVRTVFTTAPRPMPEWKRRRATGGGALLDLGAHHIDLIRFLFSREPVSVRATIESKDTEEDTSLLELELEDGLHVHGFFSLAAAEQDQIEVYGDRARLSVSRFTSMDVSVMDNPGRGGGALGRIVRRAGAIRHVGAAIHARRSPLREPGYAVALDRFIEAVRTRRLSDDAANVEDGYACVSVIDAAERSARSGQTEKLDTGITTSHRSASLLQPGSP